MISVAGVFKSRSDAQRGSTQLLATGISKDRINLLTPEASEKELGAVPVSYTHLDVYKRQPLGKCSARSGERVGYGKICCFLRGRSGGHRQKNKQT